MNKKEHQYSDKFHRLACDCCGGNHSKPSNEITRRKFVQVTGTAALGTVVSQGLTWAALVSDQTGEKSAPLRESLVVKPIFTFEIPVHKEKTSWRGWGGIQTEKDSAEEIKRISEELKVLDARADFPVSFLPVSGIRNAADIENIGDLESADMFIVYAAGGNMDMFHTLNKMNKDIIFFCRHKSGPVYLWYEIISPRFLRQRTDALAVKGIDENDVVIDNQDELLWRLRALCGLKNTVGSRILAIGGPSAWEHSLDVIMKPVQEKYKLDIQDVTFEEFGRLITEARADNFAVNRARIRSDKYLQDSGIKLETNRKFVENSFILEDILIRLMDKFSCRAVTISQCWYTIIPMAETTACLTLSLLNDAGYLAFCESDFVVVPAGILLANITGKPMFLSDPTYPHENIITIAHCTAPRMMDGKKLNPVRIMTNFESDYGAAPKIEMPVGQEITNIMPDFEFKRNVGLSGKIVSNTSYDICRSQIDVSFNCDSKRVAERMAGFHWITVFGDYMKETEYALKKIGIEFEKLV